jgi:uncharacterized protein DUF6448
MKVTAVIATAAVVVLLTGIACAHCDTLGGPVIADARLALENGDVTPALKWIKPEREAEIRAAFQKALIVRSKGADAKEIADRYFFETLVRIHRAGENAPFTGLKDEPPAGPILLADEALQSGSVDELVRQTTSHIGAGLRMRFIEVAEARKHANDSVASGRKYVALYVEFMHYVEGLNAVGAEETHAESAAAYSHH